MFHPSYASPDYVPRVEENATLTKLFLPDQWNPIHILEDADSGPAHDHPLKITANIVRYGYVEDVWVPTAGGGYTLHLNVHRLPGTTHQIEAETIHRIKRLLGKFSVTYAEPTAAFRPWHFYDPQPDGSILRSPNWNGPWELWHPAGPVIEEDCTPH